MRVQLLFLVLLAGFLSASFPKFILERFEPDQNLSLQPLASRQFALVVAEGKEFYLFDLEKGQPLYDTKEISQLLLSDLRQKSQYEAKVSLASGLMKEIRLSREKNEKQCMVLTGTDAHNCTDKQSCIVACKSNPNCDVMLYANGFWEALLDWSKKRNEFDSKLAEYEKSVALGNFAQASKALSEMSAIAASIGKNPIFLNQTDAECQSKSSICFQYCQKIDYGIEKISNALQAVESLRMLSDEAAKQEARAQAIVENSKAQDLYLSTRDARLQEFILYSENKLRTLSEKASKIGQDAATSSSMLSQLGLVQQNISQLGKAGLYRKAFALALEFEKKALEAEQDINRSFKEYEAILRSISELEQSINKSEPLIGANVSKQYLGELKSIKEKMSQRPLQESANEVENLSKRFSQLVLEKAPLQAQAGASALPASCAPAAILLLILAASARRV
ncbi:MAG: hypothetical protein N3G80_01040 [Candidatus Micrarchaeota archaeon]|nr:hypothetical protein [Candidatus Micrarchaeota archaeon]